VNEVRGYEIGHTQTANGIEGWEGGKEKEKERKTRGVRQVDG